MHPRQHQNDALYEHMLYWVEQRAHESLKEDDIRDMVWIRVFDDDLSLQQVLMRLDFVHKEQGMVLMQRILDSPLAQPVLPAGWQLRHIAGEYEFAERVAIHREVWHPSKVTLEAYQRMRTIPGYTPELDIVAVTPDGSFASYCICWLDIVNKCGEFEPVGTRPAFRRKGIGRAVMLEGLRRLKARGAETAIVRTNYANDAAIKLYESVGFHIVAREYGYARRLTH